MPNYVNAPFQQQQHYNNRRAPMHMGRPQYNSMRAPMRKMDVDDDSDVYSDNDNEYIDNDGDYYYEYGEHNDCHNDAFPDDRAEIPGAPTPPIILSLTHYNEYDPTHCSPIDKLYSSVAIKYAEQTLAAGEVKAPIDCICMPDTSGSMYGSKIEDAKKALNLVVSVLSLYDRLAIVDLTQALCKGSQE